MQLILFRHGVAEKRGSRAEDGARELLETGRHRIRESAKVLGRAVDPREVVLLASPTVRTRQTAELLRASLHCGEVRLLAAIEEGDLDGLFDALRGLPADACVIAVGHRPHLDRWCERISGVRVALDKGGAVCLALQPDALDSGEIIWLMQPAGWKAFATS